MGLNRAERVGTFCERSDPFRLDQMVSELVADRARRPHPEGRVLALPPLRWRKNSDRYRGQHASGGSVENPHFWEKWPDYFGAPHLLCRTTQLPLRDRTGSAEVMWTCRLAPLGA